MSFQSQIFEVCWKWHCGGKFSSITYLL